MKSSTHSRAVLVNVWMELWQPFAKACFIAHQRANASTDLRWTQRAIVYKNVVQLMKNSKFAAAAINHVLILIARVKMFVFHNVNVKKDFFVMRKVFV